MRRAAAERWRLIDFFKFYIALDRESLELIEAELTIINYYYIFLARKLLSIHNKIVRI